MLVELGRNFFHVELESLRFEFPKPNPENTRSHLLPKTQLSSSLKKFRKQTHSHLLSRNPENNNKTRTKSQSHALIFYQAIDSDSDEKNEELVSSRAPSCNFINYLPQDKMVAVGLYPNEARLDAFFFLHSFT